MDTTGSWSRSTVWRTALAIAILVVLAVFVGRQIVPSVSPLVVLAYACGGAAALLAIVAIVASCSAAIGQFVLNRGGTDPQWLWFGSEPRGLAQLRDAARVGEDEVGRPSRRA